MPGLPPIVLRDLGNMEGDIRERIFKRSPNASGALINSNVMFRDGSRPVPLNLEQQTSLQILAGQYSADTVTIFI